MLLIFALFTMLLVVAVFRKPGIPFFSVVSVFNCKSKLTGLGAKLYLAASVLVIAGILSSFSSSKTMHPSTPEPARKEQQAVAGNDARQASADRTRDELETLTTKFTISAGTLASLMETNGMAESRLELCNSFFETGMSFWKTDHNLQQLRVAVRDCHHVVIGLCSENGAEDAAVCARYRSTTAGAHYD